MTDYRNQMAASLFMPVSDGYVYREPYRLPFTKARHFRVNDAQKDRILDIVVPRRPIVFLCMIVGILCLSVAMSEVAIWAVTRHERPTPLDTVIVVALTFLQCSVAFLSLRRKRLQELQPLISELPVTDLTIARTVVQQQMARAMSTRQLMFVVAGNLFACISFLLSGIIFIVLHQYFATIDIVLAGLFAFLAAIHYRRLVERGASPYGKRAAKQ